MSDINIADSKTISIVAFVVCNSVLSNNLQGHLNDKKVGSKMSEAGSRSQLKVHDETEKLLKLNLDYFINNICQVCSVEESSLILSLIYLDRIISKKSLSLNFEALQQLLIGCVTAAVKFNQDYHSLNKMQAITGFQQQHLINIETWTLEALGYSLYVDQKIYKTYAFHLANLKMPILSA